MILEKKMKKYAKYLFRAALILILLALAVFYFRDKGTVTIYNHSNQTIKNVVIIYGNPSDTMWIGDIPADDSQRAVVNYQHAWEKSLSLQYETEQNQRMVQELDGYVVEKKHYKVEIEWGKKIDKI